MNVAICHDYFYQYGGAEKVVEAVLELYPEADIYSLIFIPEEFKKSTVFMNAWKENRIHTSVFQPFFYDYKKNKKRWTIHFFKHLYFLYPFAMSFLRVKQSQNIFISSTYCGKNINLNKCSNTRIAHYCHTPTRFLHNLINSDDQNSLPKIIKIIMNFFHFFLRKFDLYAAEKLNQKHCQWIANSHFIQEKIYEIYHTESKIIYPFADLEFFLSIPRNPDNHHPFFLCHGRISFHKRIDLAIRTCLKMNRRLKISGSSSNHKELEYLKQIVDNEESKSPHKKGLIEFLGRTSNDDLKNLVSGCQAFLFPGREDFGIAPIEMLSSGVPVIAYKEGGALDYIQEGINGIFFNKQTVESMSQAILDFERQSWKENEIRNSSKKFSKNIFQSRIQSLFN